MSSDSIGDLLAGAGGEVVGAGDLEAAQHGLARDAVAEIDDVVDDGGIAGRLAIGDLGIGGGEDDVADRLERDAVVPRVEPDQRLPSGRRTIGAGVDVDRLVDGILRGRFERVLDLALGIDVMAGGGRARSRVLTVSTRAQRRHHSGPKHRAQEGAPTGRSHRNARFTGHFPLI